MVEVCTGQKFRISPDLASIWPELKVCRNQVAQDSVGCGLDDGFEPSQAQDFSSTLCVQTGSGAHPASCIVGTGCSLSGGKAAEA
jgi:hypothetical protein